MRDSSFGRVNNKVDLATTIPYTSIARAFLICMRFFPIRLDYEICVLLTLFEYVQIPIITRTRTYLEEEGLQHR